MITLKDIAEVAGVSISTVSRIFAGKTTISPETRQRVMSVAEELMFKKGLVTQKINEDTYRIAIIIPGKGEFYHDDPSSSADIRSLQQSLQQNGDTFELITDNGETDPASAILAKIRHMRADGAVIFDPRIDSNLLARLKQNDIPHICTNGAPNDSSCSMVDYDNTLSMKELTDLVINSGHRNLLVLTGPEKHLVNQNRIDGMMASLNVSGIHLPADQIISGEFALESGLVRMTAAIPLIKERSITAVIAYSDYIALGAMKALKKANYRIPEDISIVGFDDVSFAAFSDPALTTVHRNYEGLADLICQNMRSLIKGANNIQSIRVRVKASVIIRESLLTIRG